MSIGQLRLLTLTSHPAGKDLDTIVGSESIDVHCLASLAKMWFRELPEVIPMDFYHSFIRASSESECEQFPFMEPTWKYADPKKRV